MPQQKIRRQHLRTITAGSELVRSLADLWREFAALHRFSLSPGAINAYELAVRQLAEFAGESRSPRDITAVDISNFLAAGRTPRGEPWTPATQHQRYRSLKRFFGWLVDAGVVEKNPLGQLAAPRIPRKIIRGLSREEVQQLLAFFDPEDPLDVRDKALVLTLIDTGLRASELLSMQAGGLYDDVTVMGKGRKERRVYLGDAARAAVLRYVRAWRVDRGPLWVNRYLQPLTRHGLRYIFVRLEKPMGGRNLYTHLMRHTFASLMLAQEAPESAVVTLAGWDDPTMLRRYSRGQEIERARDVHRRYSPGDWITGR
jgi:integrase/recombinase XerC